MGCLKTHTILRITSALAFAAVPVRAQSTVDSTNKYAWSADTGWINFRPSAIDGVITGERFLSGYAWAGNTGWIHMGDGTPVNGHGYAPDLTQVTLQFATTRPTRLYRIQGSTTLQTAGPGSWADVGGLGAFATGPGSTTTKTIALPPGTARHFLRVVPVKPLQP